MLEGINYLHAKFQINILKNKKVIKLLDPKIKKLSEELWEKSYDPLSFKTDGQTLQL